MSGDGDNIVETLQGDDAPQQQFKFDPKLMENFKMPSLDELLKVLDTMDMAPEEKEKLREDLMSRSAGGGFASSFGGMPKPQRIVPSSNDMVVFLILVLLIASIFAFFGYKLYKNLVEKERRREEKAKAKQAKKKK